jgi:hypothetical protein
MLEFASPEPPVPVIQKHIPKKQKLPVKKEPTRLELALAKVDRDLM